MRLHSQFALAILAMTLLCGCGSGVKDRLYKVTGTVKFADGQPVTAGTIYFDNEKYNAFGPVHSDGSFSLTTLKPGDGAPAGKYRVYVIPEGADKTPLRIKDMGEGQEVKPQSNKFDFTVERYVPPMPKGKDKDKKQ